MQNYSKTIQEINNIRESGKYLTELLHLLYKQCAPWKTHRDLEIFAQVYLDKHNLKGAFKWYQGYPANLCTSVNNCVVHGIPDDTILQEGDLLKVDCGILYQRGISDAAFSIVIGGDQTNPQAAALIQATKGALDEGIKHIAPGLAIAHYSEAASKHMKSKGFSIIKSLTGHGVGTLVHEPPYIYNYPHPSTHKTKRQPNMVVAIEPITAENSTEYKASPINDWNLDTKNDDLGAQWEYTILVTNNGYEVLAGLQEIPQ